MPMIHVSSCCFDGVDVFGALELAGGLGFRGVELSGGAAFSLGLEGALLERRRALGLALRCHNYFPPPERDFVVNLASLDDAVWERSLAFLAHAAEFSARLGADRFGFHAGFLVDVGSAELGKAFVGAELNDRGRALERFAEGCRRLRRQSGTLRLYVENNVLSAANLRVFQGRNPFLLTCHADVLELERLLDFELLLDMGHLKVSARSLGLDFGCEFELLSRRSDYWHLSDNDGLSDQNSPLGADLLGLLEKRWRGDVAATLEVYHDVQALATDYARLNKISEKFRSPS